MKENDFREMFVDHLKSKGVPIINLKSGVLDIFLEDRNRFIEIKRIRIGGPYGHDKDRGFEFGPQTRIIREMRNKPYVIAFESDNYEKCYLFSPEQVKDEFEKRKKWDTVGFWEEIRNNYYPFSEPHCKPLSYKELLDRFTKTE
jgi:hypothetical protein